MAKIELRDKTYDRQISTAGHNYYFCKSDGPKQIDIFARTSVPGWKDRVIKAEDGREANYNLYVSVRDFMSNNMVFVELTKEEESFYKAVCPEIHKKWLELNPKEKKKKE